MFTSNRKAACVVQAAQKLFFCFTSDDRHLFDLFANCDSFQGENHIRCSLKETNITLPTHAAFTMLQAGKLLFHLSAAVRTVLVTGSHAEYLAIKCGVIISYRREPINKNTPMPESTGVSFYLRSCRPQRKPMIKVMMDDTHIPKTDIYSTVLYIALIAPEIFCKLPSSQTAIMGMPRGLTRKASASRIRPFCTE